jgi:hypothetical protein
MEFLLSLFMVVNVNGDTGSRPAEDDAIVSATFAVTDVLFPDGHRIFEASKRSVVFGVVLDNEMFAGIVWNRGDKTFRIEVQ